MESLLLVFQSRMCWNCMSSAVKDANDILGWGYTYAIKASICLIRQAFSFLAVLWEPRPMNMLASSDQEHNQDRNIHTGRLLSAQWIKSMTLGKQTSEPGQRFLQTQESNLCVLLMNRSIPRPSGYTQQAQAHGSLLKYSFPLKQPDMLIPRVYVIDTCQVCLPYWLLSN